MAIAANWKEADLLDEEQVNMLNSEILDEDRSLLAELLELYQAESREAMAGLLEALRGNDLEQLIANAHALAGSSANIGLNRFSRLMRHLEVQTITVSERDQLRITIEALYAESMSALEHVARNGQTKVPDGRSDSGTIR